MNPEEVQHLDEWGRTTVSGAELKELELEELKKEVAFLRTRLRRLEDEVRRLKWGKAGGRRS